jgi:catechol 2,3-dioxygenase-like lactoylglutathione lyase family enzyme
MIQRISHMTVFCLDQDAAKEFYVTTLGFEVREDESLGGFRWLTVAPKGQQIEMILMPIVSGPMIDAESALALRKLVEKGMIGAGVLLTDDARKTYEELSAKGVKFAGPPAERPYGLEVLMRDNSGIWYSVVERRGS